MYRDERTIRDTGQDSVNNTGDNNTFYINHGAAKPLNRTLLYDFCEIFSSTVSDTNYDLVAASDIQEKMDYNEIVAYREIFHEVEHFIDDVATVLDQIPKRELIVASINHLYDRIKRRDQWPDKDGLCDSVYNEMFEMVAADRNSVELYREEAERAIHALMYYAFVKCKILDPVPPQQVI